LKRQNSDTRSHCRVTGKAIGLCDYPHENSRGLRWSLNHSFLGLLIFDLVRLLAQANGHLASVSLASVRVPSANHLAAVDEIRITPARDTITLIRSPQSLLQRTVTERRLPVVGVSRVGGGGGSFNLTISLQGTIIVADNVVKPGNPPYLSYVRATPAQKQRDLPLPSP
jgi:hypothetical protein